MSILFRKLLLETYIYIFLKVPSLGLKRISRDRLLPMQCLRWKDTEQNKIRPTTCSIDPPPPNTKFKLNFMSSFGEGVKYVAPWNYIWH
jgi:hypothetical protein